ncbi:hypothetical protein [Pelagibacterium xiamenense]|uniref:hypothetical protein n=1 Tax=Pelagibacterium xiamenense TaxID=2901140 RepID=UPI001E316777|nr:hypothetical protein [Pelagibacterium xiamenense]MCD7058925.1 hypothetical protein [Pelagibacterium xiamenense]
MHDGVHHHHHGAHGGHHSPHDAQRGRHDAQRGHTHDDVALRHHGHGHNHPHGAAEHLHSHPHGEGGNAEELKVLSTAFLDGFRAAEDKTSYLRLAGIPFHREGGDGLTQHLVDARIESHWQLGTASPAFASKELMYLPFPGPMVTARETMTFTYVSLTERADIDLATLLTPRLSHEET